MSTDLKACIERALAGVIDVHTGRDLMSDGALRGVVMHGDQASISLELGYPAAGYRQALSAQVQTAMAAVEGLKGVAVDIGWRVDSAKAQHDMRNMEKVKNIIAVASGKGGVGKSTTSVNLALALQAEGAKVGLLDADIYGPSQQMMLGIDDSVRPEQQGQQYLMPVIAHGLKTMSMGYLVTDKTPMVWRGPMAGGALQQLLAQTWWGELDYLIIDMPPGTGDIQLTLTQKANLAGAVIVTTPQDIALLDAQKGIEMFCKVGVPVLGVVENMAIHICSQCGHREHIFGAGGGDRIARDYGVPLLGALPLAMSIREQTDCGKPTVAAQPDGEIAGLYRDIARRTAARLTSAVSSGSGVQMFPNISVQDD